MRDPFQQISKNFWKKDIYKLCKEKRYDEAWRHANASLEKVMEYVASGKWRENDKFKLDTNNEVFNAVEFEVLNITTHLFAIFRAMAGICHREKKYNKELTYYLISTTMDPSTKPSLEKVIEKLKEKADNPKQAEKEAKIISKRWLDLLGTIK